MVERQASISINGRFDHPTVTPADVCASGECAADAFTDSPSADPHADVLRALEVVRPAMQADGGGVELVKVKDGVVSVRLCGTCLCCPSSGMTMKLGIERAVKQRLPWVRSVVRVP